jgi:hypothetical protein
MNNPKPVGLLPRVLLLMVALPLLAHVTVGVLPALVLAPGSLGEALRVFLGVERLATRHPVPTGIMLVGAAVLVGLIYARWVHFWNERAIAKATGLDDDLRGLRFPEHEYDPLRYLCKGPRGHTFVGLTPTRRFFPPWGLSWKPVYLSPQERSMHRHVLGKTGSGKTSSILWPQVLQDTAEGRGVVVIDAKGSTENAWMMRSIAHACRRLDDLRVFSLPAWNQPGLFSHTYNLVHVAPRGRENTGGDVLAMAERVFSVLDVGDNPYFRTQAFLAFTRICRLLHGMVDARGNGVPFNLRDVAVCVRGLAASSTPWGKAVNRCLSDSLDREAAEELRAQVLSLGKDVGPCLSGLLGAVDRYQAPLVNAYSPELVFEDVLARNRLVYVQLPSNLFKIQAPALGRVMLMDLQQEASLRQVFRGSRNQTPCSVNVDEFGSFADLSIIDSLNKLRDANIYFTLSHQSLADLELLSKEFAQAVWDNTRTKDILALDSPELGERLARSLGTTPRLEHTIQQAPNSLALITATGARSTRTVEAYRLHPNRLKMLASRGQGFLFATRKGRRTAIPVAYGCMPEGLPLPPETSLVRHDQERAAGLRLYERLFKAGSSPGDGDDQEPSGVTTRQLRLGADIPGPR